MDAVHRHQAFPATTPVRPGDELDVEAVRRYLRLHVPGFPDEPLEVRQFSTGASNLTYLLISGDWAAVLRRPPFGPLPPKGHDMARESAILAKIHPVFPLAPKPFAFCADETILGAPFFVMEYRRGIVLDGHFPPGFEPTPEQCRRIAWMMIDTLADLHNVDYQQAGLEAFGRPDGFLERQVAGWLRRWERVQTEEVPVLTGLVRWLRDHMPRSPAPTVIHNDFKLNNLLFSPGLERVVGVVDWEMATIGDPFFDLAVALSYWMTADDPEPLQNGLPTLTVLPGFPTREELARRYADRTGRDVGDLRWYLAFAYFKLAVIVQQLYYRWKLGKTHDPRFAGLGQFARHLILRATEVAAQPSWP